MANWTEPDLATVLATARSYWPTLADRPLERLAGENLNLAAWLTDGSRAVLKVATDPDANVPLEEAMLAAMSAANLPVPVATLTGDGQAVITLDGKPSRLQRFLPGAAWRDLPEVSPALGKAMGVFLARVHAALSNFEHTGAHRTHSWDVAACGQHVPKLQAVADVARRTKCETILNEHVRDVVPALASCSRGMLHGDANDENVLVEGDNVVGLIDFGDALYGAYVQDLGITLAYAVQHGKAPNFELAASILAGYNNERQLSKTERRLLFPLLKARLATSALIGAARRAEQAGHATWYSHEDTTWRAFDAVTHVPTDEGTAAVCRLLPSISAL